MESKFAFEMSLVSFFEILKQFKFRFDTVRIHCEILMLLGFPKAGKNWKEMRLVRIKLICHTRIFQARVIH